MLITFEQVQSLVRLFNGEQGKFVLVYSDSYPSWHPEDQKGLYAYDPKRPTEGLLYLGSY